MGGPEFVFAPLGMLGPLLTVSIVVVLVIMFHKQIGNFIEQVGREIEKDAEKVWDEAKKVWNNIFGQNHNSHPSPEPSPSPSSEPSPYDKLTGLRYLLDPLTAFIIGLGSVTAVSASQLLSYTPVPAYVDLKPESIKSDNSQPLIVPENRPYITGGLPAKYANASGVSFDAEGLPLIKATRVFNTLLSPEEIIPAYPVADSTTLVEFSWICCQKRNESDELREIKFGTVAK